MRHQSEIKKDETGFTLIEVMVVIGIIAILAGAAIPGFSVLIPKYRLKSAAQDLYSSMQSTKLEAIRFNSTRTITFNSNGTYTKPNGTVIVLADYGSGVGYGRPDSGNNITYADGATLSYQPRGFAEQGEVYIINDKGDSYSIGTIASGVVQLKRWNGSSWQ